jgi:hypothetical protein
VSGAIRCDGVVTGRPSGIRQRFPCRGFGLGEDFTALVAWNKEWSRTDKNYTQRVSDITKGQGFAAGFALNGAAVSSAPIPADTLTGSSGQDLFYSNPMLIGGVGDMITDRVKTGSLAETLISVES